MKARTFAKQMKEGVKNLGRNGWMTFASISAVTVTLLLVGSFLLLVSVLNTTANAVESDVTLQVLIDTDTTEEEQSALGNKIENLGKVAKVEYSTKEEELEKIIEGYGEQGQAYAAMKEMGENPLNDVFIVYPLFPRDIEHIQEAIESFDHVFLTVYQDETVGQLFQFMDYARYVGIALIVGLIFTAMFLISNTIKITIFSRRREIEIMKLVGATNSYIRWPFFLEGLFLGILGAIVPITILALAFYYIIDLLSGQSLIVTPDYQSSIMRLSFILVGIGVVIGGFGSMISIRRFLKV
ncbi:ABC transporter permease [Bacillaceae bacterium SIJ1]|uniref:permease-like cell division protein FtsX n=1 Tax=Litoribacterium kuwaitense TaxID=1398745 RepID=UPI0013EDB324|nr:permease-like cell division protein FtsX [Litoribacterium kuwaitense]NGP44919.1 ABC transporter permease [Litoribacterium kuwaitense]